MWGCFHAHIPVLSSVSTIFPSSIFAFTSVTYPSSCSTSSSIRLNILSAPASAITIEFICWDTCPKGLVNAFTNCKNAAIPPIVNIPFIDNIPPTTATNTYPKFPIFIIHGIKIFA